jgi:hypothetical protein
MERIKYYKDDPNFGWKLHLRFNEDNPMIVKIIDDYLSHLYEKYGIRYKIGHGGGKQFDQPGKEATVYCGSKDNAKIIANLILVNLGGVLLKPHSYVRKDDMQFNKKVMGRFCAEYPPLNIPKKLYVPDDDCFGRPKTDYFNQYGRRGIPYLDSDRHFINHGVGLKINDQEVGAKKWCGIASDRSNKILQRDFKEYYTGSKLKNETKELPPLTTLGLRKKKLLKRKAKRKVCSCKKK